VSAWDAEGGIGRGVLRREPHLVGLLWEEVQGRGKRSGIAGRWLSVQIWTRVGAWEGCEAYCGQEDEGGDGLLSARHGGRFIDILQVEVCGLVFLVVVVVEVVNRGFD